MLKELLIITLVSIGQSQSMDKDDLEIKELDRQYNQYLKYSIPAILNQIVPLPLFGGGNLDIQPGMIGTVESTLKNKAKQVYLEKMNLILEKNKKN